MKPPNRIQKPQPLTIPLILTYDGGPLDGLELAVDFTEDELDQITGKLKPYVDLAVCRYHYESPINYTPTVGCYLVNYVKTERLLEK